MKAVFLDLETNGLCFDRHVTLDVGIVIVDLNETSNITTYTACIRTKTMHWLFSDEKALEINGFTKENHDPIAKDDWIVSREVEKFLLENEIFDGKAFFICQNPSFDRPFFVSDILSVERMRFLKMPYHWLDLASMYWMRNYATKDCCSDISLSKDSIAESFGIPLEKKPHRALAGAIHLAKCYMALTGKNDNIQKIDEYLQSLQT